jgi:hypothetical protein
MAAAELADNQPPLCEGLASGSVWLLLELEEHHQRALKLENNVSCFAATHDFTCRRQDRNADEGI